jgi:hypothetical protein
MEKLMKLNRYIALVFAMALLAYGSATTAAAAPSEGAILTYTHPSGLWSVTYPANLLQVEELNADTTIFISEDRHTFAAVDSYTAAGNAYGNTGEGLRNRARVTLARIYGKAVQQQAVLTSPGAPWEQGITFTTAKGSKGTAVYEQRGRDRGDFRVNGFLYGYKASAQKTMLPILQSLRASFTMNVTPADLEQARNAAGRYFTALFAGRYDEAAALYGGSYETLVDWNPTIAPSDHAALLRAGCTNNGLQCLAVKRVARVDAQSTTDFTMLVEFINDDGSTFKHGSTTQFLVRVKKSGVAFQVLDLPVYVA